MYSIQLVEFDMHDKPMVVYDRIVCEPIAFLKIKEFLECLTWFNDKDQFKDVLDQINVDMDSFNIESNNLVLKKPLPPSKYKEFATVWNELHNENLIDIIVQPLYIN